MERMLIQYRKTTDTLVAAKSAYQEIAETVIWLWCEILSPYGRSNATKALACMLGVMFLTMSVTYVMKDIVDALAVGNRELALWLLLFAMGGIMLTARLFLSLHDHWRELAWNDNFSSLIGGFSRLFFRRPASELSAEKGEVGAEQVESAKDRAQNILYMILFEGSSVVFSMMASTALMFTVDVVAGAIVVALIGLNILWFLLFNAVIDKHMGPIDKEFRRANRRMVEKWNYALSTKVNSVEDKICKQITDEIAVPLAADKKIWAYWFIYVDLARAIMNVTVAIAVLAYGIKYAGWSAGSFAAMAGWMTVTVDKFGYVGHLMRHMTSQVARIKAVRLGLSSQPKSLYNVGVPYVDGPFDFALDGMGVTYSNDREILRDVSFAIPSGKRVAIIGPSGAGKSTIVSLLRGDDDPTRGRVLLDGVNLRDWRPDSVLCHMGSILQRPEIMSGDVRENILHGVPIGMTVTDEEIWKVIDLVSPDLRGRFDNGLDTQVGKQGLELSGGEQQRLCVMRALIKKPRLLLVDEATSSLDSETEVVVQEGIDTALSQGISAVVIAHRFSTLHNCDQFVVLRKLSDCKPGESQVEAVCDSMVELYKKSPTFKRLADKQKFVP